MHKINRKTALELIRIECAKTGEITQFALRYYTENRISYQAFIQAAKLGIKQYQNNTFNQRGAQLGVIKLVDDTDLTTFNGRLHNASDVDDKCDGYKSLGG